MASKFSLSAILSLTDNLTRPYKNTTRKVTAMNRTLGKSFTRLNRGINKTAKFLAKGLAIGAGIGLAAVSAGLVAVTREFARFDDTIVGATARFKDLEIGTKETAETMKELKRTARETARVTQFTATEAAAGLNFFAKAGFTSAEAMAALKTQVDLATVAELDLATTSDITSDLLGALGLNAADSATKIANLEKLSNSLGIAANMANVTLTDIFETLKIGAPIATAAGADMNDLIAMTASLGSAGIKGSQGATAIKNAYLNLATNAPVIQKALEGIGLAQKDFINQETGALDMVKAMRLLGKATEGLDPTEQVAAFNEIFGKRAIAGAINMSKNLAEIENITKALESDKRISTIADEIRKGLGMQIKILKSGLIELGFQFIETFEINGRNALSLLIEKVQTFDMQKIIVPVKNAVQLFKQFATFIKDNIGLIKALGIGLLAFVVVIKLLAVAMKIYTVVQWLANTAAWAFPVFAIIAGVIALIAIVVLLVKNWDKVVVFLTKVWTKVVTFVVGGLKKLWNKFSELLDNPFFVAIGLLFAPWLTIPALIIKHWEPIKEFFTNLWINVIKPLIAGVANIGGKIGQFFGGDREKRRERQEDGTRPEIARTEVQQIRTETQRRSEEREQRHDIFLHGPAGTGISGTPGGFPQQAVQLGVQ